MHRKRPGRKRCGCWCCLTCQSRVEQRLCNIVHELAIAANMRSPQAMVLPCEDSINVFAAGWDQDDAIVAVTQDALERLIRDELMGLPGAAFCRFL